MKINCNQAEARDRFGHDPKPALPRTAIEFSRRYAALARLAMRWAHKYFSLEIGAPRMSVGEMKQLGRENPLLVGWIDSIASAYGHNWLTLFSTVRHLLVVGVLGTVLKDRVFGAAFFGGSWHEKELLRMLDQQLERKECLEFEGQIESIVSTDASVRQKPRATFINSGLHKARDLPVHFADEVKQLYDQLVRLFQPLLLTNEGEVPDPEYYLHLDKIVALAAKLSLDMRREPDTVYHLASTPPRHTCLARRRMSPVIFDMDEVRQDPADFDSYSNLISVWPGLFAYRGLTPYSATTQTIHRALIYTRPMQRLDSNQVDEQNPDNILTISQLWEYLHLLGV